MSNVLAKAAIVALLTLAACSGSESERSPVLSDPGASTMSAKTVDEVQISAVADAASVTAGDPIGYVITVADTGKGTGKKLVLTDTLPTNAGLAWSISPENSACTIASNVLDCSVTLGKSSSFSVHVVSPTTQSSCGTVSDQASVGAKNGPSTTSNTAVIAIGCPLHGTSLSVPSSGGDTNVKVADVSTLGTTVAAATNAGDTNIKVTSTAPFYGTTLAAPSSGGDTDIKVLSTADLQPGETVHIDSESAIVAAVGSSGLTGTGVTLAAPLAFGHVLGSSVTVAGQSIRIDFGAGQETATIASIGTPGPDGTGLTLAAPLSLAHATGSQVLIPTVSIDSGANQQTVTLTSVGTAGAGGTGISFTPPLNASHATGAAVIPTQP